MKKRKFCSCEITGKTQHVVEEIVQALPLFEQELVLDVREYDVCTLCNQERKS